MERNVVVTGFGPFRDYKKNPSWTAVEKLQQIGLENSDFNLITQEVPVVYEKVREVVPMLWEKYKPILMVHVGVSSKANCIAIEECAHNHSYNLLDTENCLPEGNLCKEMGVECIQSKMNLEKICIHMNNNSSIKATLSNDAGRYLCEFIYYTSLFENDCSSAFIHIPPEDRPYSILELAEGLKFIIKNMLKQIE